MDQVSKKSQQRRRKAQKKAMKKERQRRLLEKETQSLQHSPIMVVPPQPKPTEPLPEPDNYEEQSRYCVIS